jgi:hypothetical protein
MPHRTTRDLDLLEEVVATLSIFLAPILAAVPEGWPGVGHWPPGGRWI